MPTPRLRPIKAPTVRVAKSGKPSPPADLNAELDSARELTDLEKAIKQSDKTEYERFRALTDTEYWCCLCFQTREQKEEFLALAGWLVYGDKYIDGMQIAKKMGLRLTSPVPPIMKHRKWKA